MAELPILHSKRAEYSWVERLTMLREQYDAALAADPGRRTRDDEWLDGQCVRHSLLLKGIEPGPDDVERGAAAMRRVRAAAENGDELTPTLLREIHGLIDPARAGQLRPGAPIAVYEGHQSPPAETLPALLGNVSDWFTAPSFAGDFHPVEQSALALVRVSDLQPFPSNNEMTARLAAQLFVLRAGWPPIIIHNELEQDYRRAILHALHMDTQPVVELLARCVEITLASDLTSAR